MSVNENFRGTVLTLLDKLAGVDSASRTSANNARRLFVALQNQGRSGAPADHIPTVPAPDRDSEPVLQRKVTGD